MMLEITIGAGAICGVIHRLGKLGVIPSYGYGSERTWPAWLKFVAWAHVLAGVALIGKFESFESGIMFGLIFVGSWKLSEELAEAALDLASAPRS